MSEAEEMLQTELQKPSGKEPASEGVLHGGHREENPTPRQMALEEIKLLQAVVAKQDDLRSNILGWCATLITGLTVAYMSKTVVLRIPAMADS